MKEVTVEQLTKGKKVHGGHIGLVCANGLCLMRDVVFNWSLQGVYAFSAFICMYLEQ